jgi:hypothetical protein
LYVKSEFPRRIVKQLVKAKRPRCRHWRRKQASCQASPIEFYFEFIFPYGAGAANPMEEKNGSSTGKSVVQRKR